MLELTKENFKPEVLESDRPVVVDFWAPWCAPCVAMGPIFEELANETKEVKFGKVNVDGNSGLAEEYGVRGIPTIVFFKDSKNMGNLVGMVPKQVLQDKMKELF